MTAPIPSAQLNNRIDSFLSRKHKQYPDISLLSENSLSSDEETGKEDVVWFRNAKELME
jgi:hypothetical protein